MVFETVTPSDWITFWSALVGAVFGSVTSGAISYVLARQSNKQVRLLESDARRDSEKAVAFRLMMKILKIGSYTKSLSQHIEESIASASKNIESLHLWAKVPPIVSSNEAVTFDADELAIFVAMGDYEYLNQIIMIDDRYNALADGFRAYSSRREVLTSQMHASDENFDPVSDTAIVSALGETEYQKLAPLMMQLNKLIDELRVRSNEEILKINSAAAIFGPKMRVYFKDDKFPILSFINKASEN